MHVTMNLFMLFKVQDYQNTVVILSKTTWYKKLLDPVFGHPEIKSFRTKIKTTLTDPDYIFQSIRDQRSKLYLTKITQGVFAFYFLVVVVKYIKERDKIIRYVSTVMINRKLPKTSKLLWERKIST